MTKQQRECLRLKGYILKRLAEIDRLKKSPAYKNKWSQGNLAGQDYALRAMASQF